MTGDGKFVIRNVEMEELAITEDAKSGVNAPARFALNGQKEER